MNIMTSMVCIFLMFFQDQTKLSGNEKILAISEAPINSASSGPEGVLVAYGNKRGDVRVIDWQNSSSFALPSHKRQVSRVCFARDRPIVASSGDDFYVHVYSVTRTEGTKLFSTLLPSTAVGLALSASGKRLACGFGEGNLHYWSDFEKGLCQKLQAGTKMIIAVAFSRDEKMLACVNQRGQTFVFDLETTKLLWTFENVDDSFLSALSFSPSSERIATIGGNGLIDVWDLKSGKKTKIFQGRKGSASIDYSPDGRYLITGGLDGKFSVLDTETSASIAIDRHKGFIRSVFFTNDGANVVSSASDGLLLMWDFKKLLERAAK